MSLRAMAWAYARTETKGAEKFVLVTLADIADDDGTCFPGRRYIAEKTGLSPRQVTRYVSELKEKGLLTITERWRDDGSRASNQYALPLDTYDQGGVSDTSRGPGHGCPGNDPSVDPSDEPTPSSPTRSAKDTKRDEEIRDVFGFFQKRYSPRSKLDAKRRRRINARLDEDFTARELKRAIAAAKHDDWLSGRHPKSPGYLNNLHTLLRDRQQVERLLDLADRVEAQQARAQARAAEAEEARAAELRAMRGDDG